MKWLSNFFYSLRDGGEVVGGNKKFYNGLLEEFLEKGPKNKGEWYMDVLC